MVGTYAAQGASWCALWERPTHARSVNTRNRACVVTQHMRPRMPPVTDHVPTLSCAEHDSPTTTPKPDANSHADSNDCVRGFGFAPGVLTSDIFPPAKRWPAAWLESVFVHSRAACYWFERAMEAPSANARSDFYRG